MNQPFDLKQFTIDKENISARPVKWDKEFADGTGMSKDGSYASPIEYNATCPYCGNLLVIQHNMQSVQCDNCKHGENIISPEYAQDVNGGILFGDGVMTEEEIQKLIDNANQQTEFCDPFQDCDKSLIAK